MEYCFTSEGTDKRPQASSLRGLDAATYYRHNGLLNCGHAVVRQLILDSLHYWADDYQVDGFCFVNAETLVQGELLHVARYCVQCIAQTYGLLCCCVRCNGQTYGPLRSANSLCSERKSQLGLTPCVHADSDGNILDNPPLADDIAQDALLQSLKLIAWVADDTLLPRLGERGFPHWGIWAERNKAFQKDIVTWLVHNQAGMASQVATR